MKSSRRGYASGIGLLVLLIAVAIGLFIMFGKMPGSGAAGGAGGGGTPANINKVNPATGAPAPSNTGTTGGSYVGNVVGGLRRGQDTAQHIYLTEIARLVGMYELSNGSYPTTMAELSEFAGDDGAWMRDPWGVDYSFAVDKATKTVRIISNGSDGQPGTGDEEAFDVKLPM